MDIGKSFTFIFDDEEWVSKLLIGVLFVLASTVIVGIPFLLGYMIRIVRNVMAGNEKPLPGWDDLGDLLKEGLILAVILIIWAIPSWGISIFQSIKAENTKESSALVPVQPPNRIRARAKSARSVSSRSRR